MGKNCPNYSHPDYKRLVAYFNGDEEQAKRVYVAQGYSLPEVPSVSEIEKELKFREGPFSELSRAMLLKRITNYNIKYNTSHRAILTRVSPTSYKAVLALNFMPKYEPIAYNEKTVKTINKIDSELEVETVLSPSDIIIREGNEFVVGGEVFPSYEDAYNSIYNEGNSNLFFQKKMNGVNYQLRSINILLSDKAIQIFNKGKKAGWDINKIITELQIPKEQKQLIVNSYNEGNTTPEQLAVDIASKYSYTVEVNTSKSSGEYVQDGEFDEEGNYLEFDPTYKTFDEKPTSYYSNLTVGEHRIEEGWEYQELEISTPLIIPSIKGHAQFSTDNGIGWVRAWYNKRTGEVHILEIQSDLFQKGRDMENLISYESFLLSKSSFIKVNEAEYNTAGEAWLGRSVGTNEFGYSTINKKGDFLYTKIDKNEYGKININQVENNLSNEFLQLLNKDSNWVTFFIKSIIQDSAKKGYEKVLFPTGETAAKVEGHQTIADEIALIDKQIQDVKDNKGNVFNSKEGYYAVLEGNKFDTQEEALIFLTSKKQELKSQGIEKLKPIEAFYEIKVGNILEKQFGKENVKTITDEYGNQWREITIDKTRDLSDIYLQLGQNKEESINEELNSFLGEFLAQYGIKVEYIDNFKERFNIDGIATADILNKTIYVAKGQEDSTTLPEEAAHFIIEMMGEKHPLFKAMSGIINETKEYQQVVDEYSEVYKGDEIKLKKEAMAKVLLTYFIKREQSKESLPVKTLSVFERVWNWFQGLFGKMNNIPLQQKLNDIFGNAANQVFDGTVKLDKTRLTSKQIYFQLNKAKEALLSSINKLERHATILEKRAVLPEYEKQAETIKNSVQVLKDTIEKKGIEAAILKFLEHAINNELGTLRDIMDRVNNDPDSVIVTSALVNQLHDIITMYTEIESDIQAGIIEDKDLKAWAVEYQGIFDDIRRDLSEGKAYVDKLKEQRLTTLIEEIKHPDSTYTVEELLRSKVGDINGIATYIAPLHAVDDEILRMVYKVVQDIYMKNQYLTIHDANELKQLQYELNKSGIKDLSFLHEKDANGKKTGYLLAQHKWGEYNQAMEQTKANIATALKNMEVPVEEYSDINTDNLNDKQLGVFKAHWAKFNEKYSTGKGKPNPPINPEFEKIMRNTEIKKYYDVLLKRHIDDKQRLAKKFQEPMYFYLVPQAEKDIMQVLASSKDSLSKNLRDKAKELYTFSASEQEVGDNKVDFSKITGGDIQKLVPIYFVRPLENKELLSDDFTSMYAHFTEMSRNFRGLTDRFDDLLLIQAAMAKRTITNKKGNTIKKGIESNAYKIYDDFLKQHVFKDYAKLKININEKEYNLTKIAKQVLAYIRGKNLFGAMFTVGASYVKGSIDSTMEDIIGVVSTKESKFWAEGEFDKNLIYLMADMGKRNKTNKLEVFFENTGVFGDVRTLFNRMDMQYRISRVTQDTIIYGAYETFGIRIKGKLALAVYDNYRLVDGKYVTKFQFKQGIRNAAKAAYKVRKKDASILELNKEADKAWKARSKDWATYREKSLYNSFEVKGNQWEIKPEYKKYISNGLISTVNGIIEQRAAAVDGRVSTLEKGGIFNSIAGQAVMMHRGWLVSGAVERFKAGGINYVTGTYEEGYYRTVYNFLTDLVTVHRKNLLHASAIWGELEPWQKRNLIRMTADLAFTALVYTIFTLMQGFADDDNEDNWLAQAMAFQTTRILMEQKAFLSIREAANLLNSPAAGLNLLDDIGAFWQGFVHNDLVEYGPYKDKHKLTKATIRITYLRNLYELQYPATKNKYVKSFIL